MRSFACRTVRCIIIIKYQQNERKQLPDTAENHSSIIAVITYFEILLILTPCVCRIVHLHMDELGFISQCRATLAGGLAGIAAALATYPLEVVETRLIVQNCREPTYIGVFHTLSRVYRSEGFLALYRGFSLTVLGVLHIPTNSLILHGWWNKCC